MKTTTGSEGNIMTELLLKAREYEAVKEKEIGETLKPLFHLIPRTGWMNDPNGFSYYNGMYHMFYQYYPYDTCWGPMHWGHAISKDLLTWENLPVALAPDSSADSFGCFSGSAIETEDGKHMIMYTGVVKNELENGGFEEIQQQCIAIGDGVDYEKIDINPVIKTEDLPEGCRPCDFRDPKMWKENGKYYVVLGSKTKDMDGQLLKYSSEDGIHWKYEGIILKNNKRYGLMWECPDYFPLDGKQVVVASPQDMLPEELEFHNGNGTVCIIGSIDENGNFHEENSQAVDYGIDFYAPQTIELQDGRRVMIGWLQNWDTVPIRRDDFPWFGQLSIPREVHIKDGRLFQNPIREIENYYTNRIERQGVVISDECSLSGIEGRVIDMTIKIAPERDSYKKFEIRFADNGKSYSTITFDAEESIVKIDRKHSGSRRAIVHQRRCSVRHNDGEIKFRLLMDRYSVELFINDGEQVMSMAIFTDYKADGISFKANGKVKMDIVMNKLER